MPDTQKDLSSRYYWAEKAVCLLSATLIAFCLFGNTSIKAIPILQISPTDAHHIPRVIAALLIFFCAYMIFEWRTSIATATALPSNRWRMKFIILFVISSIFLSYSKIVENTIFFDVSIFWFAASILTGYGIGLFLSCISFAALMIRTREQAKILSMPIIPIASRGQFVAWGPLTLILFVIYYILISCCPDVVVSLLSILSSGSFLWAIISSILNLFCYYDSEGIHIPYKGRMESFRDIHNKHDYMRLISDTATNSSDLLKTFATQTPENSQNILRSTVARGCIDDAPNYRGVLLDEISLQFNDQEEESDDNDLNKRLINICVGNDDDTVRLRVIYFDSQIPPVDNVVAIDILERHADFYLRSLSHEECLTINPGKMMNYVLQKTIEEVMTEKHGGINALLELFIQRGDAASVAKILKEKTNLNFRGVAGWTPLLHATANGYEDIVRLLLVGGANPDTANDLGITPLMFAARYNNFAICSLLVDFGSEINISNNVGATALMKACEIGNLEIVKLLVEHGAKLDVVDLNKQNALAIAHACGHGTVASYLRKILASRA